MHSTVHIRASNYECKCVRICLVFFIPINLSKPSKVLYQQCPDKTSFCFHGLSVEHHMPNLIDEFCHSSSLIVEFHYGLIRLEFQSTMLILSLLIAKCLLDPDQYR